MTETTDRKWAIDFYSQVQDTAGIPVERKLVLMKIKDACEEIVGETPVAVPLTDEEAMFIFGLQGDALERYVSGMTDGKREVTLIANSKGDSLHLEVPTNRCDMCKDLRID